MSTSTRSRFENVDEQPTLGDEPGPSSVWFVLGLRLVIGGAFLGAGLGKFAGWPFDAGGYLAAAEGPLAGVFAAMAASPALLEVINVVVPVTQVLIGVALLVGAFVRLAALGGATQMSLFYLASWEVAGPLGFVNSDLVYLVVFLTVAALGAGRVFGLDRYIEQLSVDGEPLIERYPVLGYVLG